MVYLPNYQLNNVLVNFLMKIESQLQHLSDLSIPDNQLKALQLKSKLQANHYSTMIEGNKLTLEEVGDVIEKAMEIPRKKRDENEVRAYGKTQEYIAKLSSTRVSISEDMIKMIHGFVMGKQQQSPYRDSQNVIRDSLTNGIVYLPPEAKDVPGLMTDFATYINQAILEQIPMPLIAAIAHYQFVTIHPYYDGNGRTARLLTDLILKSYGYGINGIYCLEEYYALNQQDYYNALTIGTSHNYYLGRETTEITSWLEYFCEGMLYSLEKARSVIGSLVPKSNTQVVLRELDERQRLIIPLFNEQKYISAPQVAQILGLSDRMARDICAAWVEQEFFILSNPSKKARKYELAGRYLQLIE